MTYTTTAYLLSHEGNFSNTSRIGGGIIGPGGIGALFCGLYVFGLFVIVLCAAICDCQFSLNKNNKNKIKFTLSSHIYHSLQKRQR